LEEIYYRRPFFPGVGWSHFTGGKMARGKDYYTTLVFDIF
jgi:hypothetical protein